MDVQDGAAVTTRMTRKQTGSDAVNALMVHDPRLPRTREIPCPNPECTVAPLCVSVRTDAERMIFTHICVHCLHIWTPAPGRSLEDDNEDEEPQPQDDVEDTTTAIDVDEEDLTFWADTIGSR